MPNFIDRPPYLGPFEGVLILLNVGYGFERIDKEYDRAIVEQINKAHAGNWLIVYASTGDVGVDEPPEHYDYIEERDLPRLITYCGRPDTNFDLMPGTRTEQFRRMAHAVLVNPELRFNPRFRAIIMGRCSIDRTPCLIPATEVSP